MRTWGSTTVGAVLCAVAALCLSFPFQRSPFIKFLPLLTLLVIVWIASTFGAKAGIFGTIAAAIIFAGWLFDPQFSLRVKDPTQRSNLIWMLIGGIALSELFGRMSPPTKKRHP